MVGFTVKNQLQDIIGCIFLYSKQDDIETDILEISLRILHFSFAGAIESVLFNKKIKENNSSNDNKENDKRKILEYILDGFQDAVYIVGNDYSIEYFNNPMKKLVQGKDITNRKCYQVLYNHNSVCNDCEFKSAKHKLSRTYTTSKIVGNKDFKVSNIFIENGCKISVYQDVSELKRINSVIESKNRLFSLIFDNANDSIIWDRCKNRKNY